MSIIILLSIGYGCHQRTILIEPLPADTSPEVVVKQYLMYRGENNYDHAKSLLNPQRYNDFEFDNNDRINSLLIHSIKRVDDVDYDLDEFLTQNTAKVEVKLNISYTNNWYRSGEYINSYYLVKNDDSSQWLINDWRLICIDE